MQLGMVGLGRMGGNMVLRLMRHGHDCVVYDRNTQQMQSFDEKEQRQSVKTAGLADLVKKLQAPRAVWIMLPAGDITQGAVEELAGLLEQGDTIIDGGNSYFKDDVKRAALVAQKGIHYVDVGTSGGVWGLERGYCMMIGGEKAVFDRLEPIFKSLAPGATPEAATVSPSAETGPAHAEVGWRRAQQGYIHAGKVGAGHFVKMIHNGIEYGMMQAYAEGFEILEKAKTPKVKEEYQYDFDLHDIAEVWRHGSVVSSWLLDLLELALRKEGDLHSFSGYVQDSGEGRWTVEAAIDHDVPVNVLTASLFARFRSRQDHTFADKVLSALRMGFGGHVEGNRPTGTSESAVESPTHPVHAETGAAPDPEKRGA